MKDILTKIKINILKFYESFKNIPSINLSLYGKTINISENYIKTLFIFILILVLVIIGYLNLKVYNFEPLPHNKNILNSKKIDISINKNIKSDIEKKREQLKRKTPPRDKSKIKTQIVGMPNILSYGAEPMFIKDYGIVELGYFSEKSKNFSFDIMKNSQTLYLEYYKKLIDNGWKIEKQEINGNQKNKFNMFFAIKDDLKYNINIGPAFLSGTIESNNRSKIFFMYLADNNILYRNAPKTKNLVLPPMPDGRIIFEGNIGYIPEGENNITYKGENYIFIASGSLDEVALDIENKLKLDGYIVNSEKFIPKDVIIPSQNNILPSATIIPPIINQNQKQEFIKPSPSWSLKIEKDNYLFNINISENIIGSNNKIEGKVVLTLRTDIPLLQEGIDYFKVKNTSLDKLNTVSQIKDKFSSYNISLANENSIPLKNGDILPVPIVFSTGGSFDNVNKNLENDLKLNNYIIKNIVNSGTGINILETEGVDYNLKVTLTSPIPREYSLLFSGSTMVEITPNIK